MSGTIRLRNYNILAGSVSTPCINAKRAPQFAIWKRLQIVRVGFGTVRPAQNLSTQIGTIGRIDLLPG